VLRIPYAARPAIICAMVALAVYAVTLGGTFVYDDWSIIVDDPRIADVSKWQQYLTTDYFNGGPDNLYRPLTSLSYAAQAKLFGNRPSDAWSYHLVNWFLHAAAAACVAEMARRMTRSNPAALLAGLLFAVHPIHVEAVANVVGRAELLCGLGMYLALALFIAHLSSGRALAIWACFLVALFSKEQGMLVPLLILLAIPLRPRSALVVSESQLPPSSDENPRPSLSYAQPDTPAPRRMSLPAMLLLLLLLWTLAGYLVFREHILKFEWDRSFLNPAINPLLQSRGIDRLLMPLALFGRYLALLVFPLHLSPDYGRGVIGSHASWSDPYLWIGAIGAVSFLIACVFAFVRRARTVLFCLLAFGLLYGMVANLVALIGTDFNERLMYIPSAFLCILAAVALLRLPRRAMIAVSTIVIALFAARTVTYAAQWNNPTALYATAISHHPRAIQLYLLLGQERQRMGDSAGAEQVLAEARELEPSYYRAWLISAQVALQANDPQSAYRFAAKAFELEPSLETQILMQRARQSLNHP
jgi:hypothetical protein